MLKDEGEFTTFHHRWGPMPVRRGPQTSMAYLDPIAFYGNLQCCRQMNVPYCSPQIPAM